MERLYILNLALLITHEIDSAYWQEWNLFAIPGGIQVFLALNFLLMLVGLLGLAQLLRQKPSAYIFSWLVIGAGLFAFGIHSYFLLAGHPEFRLPASLFLLAAVLVVSLCQAAATLSAMRSPRPAVTQAG